MKAHEGLQLGHIAPVALGQVHVLSGGEGEVRLAKLWGSGLSLTVFLRHFGCVGCTMSVSDLAPRFHELAQLGVRTVLLGSGDRHHLQGFIQRFKLYGKPVTVATDPSLESFKRAGLLRSRWRTAGPLGVWDRLYGLSKGFDNGLLAGQAPVQGSASQLGGALMLNDERRVVFLHRARRLGDFAPATDIISAALEARAETLSGLSP